MHTHYPIRRLNAWRLGSTVRYYSEPVTQQGLVDIYRKHPNNVIWLGLGSNILFPDHELDAHIIKTGKALSHLTHAQHIDVGAGVTLAKLARFCTKLGYEDAAFLAGIPGTVGGALRMNAGAYKHEMWDYVESVDVLTDMGVKTLSKDDFVVGYRHVQCHEPMVMFLSARLSFVQGCKNKALGLIRQYLTQRNSTQPIGTFNCGSVFRNPQGHSAWRLIDGLGLRGYQIGGARISPMHANFIENVNMQARSEDVWQLIRMVQQKVLDNDGMHLELEVTVYE